MGLDILDRPMPAEPEAERAILGAILLNPGLIHQAREMTRPEDYSVPSLRSVFTTMLALSEQNIDLDPVLIGAALRNEGKLEMVGGIGFITNLTWGVPRSPNIAHYAKVIRGKALLRDLIHEHARGIEEAFAEEDLPDVVLDNAQRGLLEISLDSRVVSGAVRSYKEISASVSTMFERWTEGETVSIPTQIPEIDRKLIYGGLAYADFIVLAAQTSQGKTAMALQIALNTARSGIPVLIFSLEMKGERLFIRNLASASNVPRREISPYTFRNRHQDTIGRLTIAQPKLAQEPIYVADKVRTLSRLSSVATDWKLRTCREGAGLIVVDYMQLVQNKLSKRSREEEVTGISRELKNLAALLDVPVLGLSQFNREPSRSNQRPELKDLRESGALEQDSDLALFIWSPNKTGEENIRAVQVYCPKQRDGPVGWDEKIDFDADHQWFKSPEMWLTEPKDDWNSQ